MEYCCDAKQIVEWLKFELKIEQKEWRREGRKLTEDPLVFGYYF